MTSKSLEDRAWYGKQNAQTNHRKKMMLPIITSPKYHCAVPM